MINWLDAMMNTIAPWGDLVALIVVCAVFLWRRSAVTAVVAADFLLVYAGQDWLRNTEFWGGLALDYHYGLGIKDALMALILIRLRAHPVITVSYVSASLLCWTVWGAYVLVEYEKFITVYHAWSPLYFLAMVFQVTGLFAGGRNAGKPTRVRRLSDHRDWVHGAGYSFTGSHAAATGGEIDSNGER